MFFLEAVNPHRMDNKQLPDDGLAALSSLGRDLYRALTQKGTEPGADPRQRFRNYSNRETVAAGSGRSRWSLGA